jgi:predicted dehydrogenase
VLKALENGKHVFVEKPLALSLAGIDKIEEVLNEAKKKPVLFVGFNRRFAPVSQYFQERRSQGSSPLHMEYRFRAIPYSTSDWYGGEGEGGRFVGEVSHAVDWILWAVGASLIGTEVQSISESETKIIFNFEDSSRVLLDYQEVSTLVGEKERIEIKFGDEKWLIRNFLDLEIESGGKLIKKLSWKSKGHLEILNAFSEALRISNQAKDPFGFLKSSRLVLELQENIDAPMLKK